MKVGKIEFGPREVAFDKQSVEMYSEDTGKTIRRCLVYGCNCDYDKAPVEMYCGTEDNRRTITEIREELRCIDKLLSNSETLFKLSYERTKARQEALKWVLNEE